MKTKLLLLLLTFGFFNTYAQQEAVDYVSNLEEPSALLAQGTTLYVQGPKMLYQVNTAATNPTPTVIYNAPTDFYMTNMTISGNMMYISQEHYSETADVFFGSRIIALDLTNPSAVSTLVYTSTQYVSALTVNGSFIYFSSETDPDGEDNFTVQIHRINATVPNPVATVLVSNLTSDYEVNDMAFYSNNLLISVGGVGTVFGIDITDSPIAVTAYFNNLNFNKGLFINDSRIFLTEGNLVGTKLLNTSNPLVYVAKNTTYQDNLGITFNANFRDTVLIGDTLYMTLLNQGKVVMIQDPSLSTEEITAHPSVVSIYNSKTSLTVNGLKNAQTATVYNISGQRMVVATLSKDETTIDISALSNGVYILKLDNQKVFKFVK